MYSRFLTPPRKNIFYQGWRIVGPSGPAHFARKKNYRNLQKILPNSAKILPKFAREKLPKLSKILQKLAKKYCQKLQNILPKMCGKTLPKIWKISPKFATKHNTSWAVPICFAAAAHVRRADWPFKEDEEPLEGSAWDNDRVLRTARSLPADLSAPRVDRGSGWEADTSLEVDDGTSVAESCGMTGSNDK